MVINVLRNIDNTQQIQLRHQNKRNNYKINKLNYEKHWISYIS